MNEDRKTPEMRAQMTDIERLRHSCAHVLATAILRIWPEAQFAAGPPVENGFYYDVELPHRISPEDLEKIEAEMRKEIKANHPFARIVVSRDQASAIRDAGGSEKARPSQARTRAGDFRLRRRRRSRVATLASTRCCDHRRTGEAGERDGVRCGLPAGKND